MALLHNDLDRALNQPIVLEIRQIHVRKQHRFLAYPIFCILYNIELLEFWLLKKKKKKRKKLTLFSILQHKDQFEDNEHLFDVEKVATKEMKQHKVLIFIFF